MSSATELIARQMAAGANIAKIWGDIIINVKAGPFFAKGDWNGTTGTDDTVALQAAINYANSIGKKEVTLPAGWYKYGVLTNTSGITFIGDGVMLSGTTPITLTSLSAIKNYIYLGAASSYGVSPTIGTADATLALNDYFTALKLKGLRYAWFDQPFTYTVSGLLSGARDLILLGDAKFDTTVKENFLIKVHKTTNVPGKLKMNACSSLTNTFQQFFKAMSENRNVKIAIIGDSLSTAGGDQLGVNYTTGGSGSPTSPSGPTPADSYIQKMINQLVTTFKSNTFDIYNYSIGGTTIDQWNTIQTFNAVTKTWIQFLKDATPDLIIIGFGMNTATYAQASSFRADFDNIIDYVAANFSPLPSTMVVTTPRPVFSIEDSWGSIVPQLSRMNAANAARKRGFKRDCYILDVGQCSDVVRTGIDFNQMSAYAEAITDIDFDNAVTASVPRIGGIYTLALAAANIETKRIYRDFVIEFDCAFQGGFTNNVSNLTLYYNFAFAGKANISLIIPVATGGSQTANYSKYSNSVENVATVSSVGPVMNDSVYRKFRLQKHGSLVELYIDNVRMWAERVETWDVPGSLRLEKSDAIGTMSLKNLKLYRMDYMDYLPTITEYEMWGQHVDADYSNKPFIGGNGANHPSSIGLMSTYERCINELIEDMETAETINVASAWTGTMSAATQLLSSGVKTLIALQESTANVNTSFNLGTNEITILKTGIYVINASLYIDAVVAGASNMKSWEIDKNGVNIAMSRADAAVTAVPGCTEVINKVVPLVKGDKITFYSTCIPGNTLVKGTYAYFEIRRMS